MRKIILIISIFILISGCNKIKKQFEKFLFDDSKVTEVTKYSYEYKDSKKISMTETTNTYYFKKLVDSMTYITTFIYGKDGLLEKEISKFQTDRKPEIKNYIYDSNDSLILKLTIDSIGDTTHWSSYKYFPDGRKIIFQRDMFLNFKSFEEINNAAKNKAFDTLLNKYDYIYDSKLCKEQKEYNKKNQPTNLIELDYQDGNLIKETFYSFVSSMKLLKKTQYYDYTKSKTNPDYFSLDSHGDTVDKKTNYYYDGKLVLSTTIYNHGDDIHKFYYENDKEIGDIAYSKKFGKKFYYSYTYYPNGDIKEESHYTEGINNKR